MYILLQITILMKDHFHKTLMVKSNNLRHFQTCCLLCSVFCILNLTGCYKPVDYPEPYQYQTTGISVQGRSIEHIVLGQGSDTTFIMATIHGNEPAGTQLVRKLHEYLQQNPDILTGKTVVLLPVANPDGLATNSRYNANGVDLNRNFIAANRRSDVKGGPEALSEPEARTIHQLIRQYNPDRIVSIHQPLACIDYDGPGQQLANHMADYCDLPVKKLGSRPGSLGSYAGVTLGIPIITFEMLKNDSTLDAQTLWNKYGKALLAAVAYPEPVQ